MTSRGKTTPSELPNFRTLSSINWHLRRVITIVITPRWSVKVPWQPRFSPLNQCIANHNALFCVDLTRHGGCRHKALRNMGFRAGNVSCVMCDPSCGVRGGAPGQFAWKMATEIHSHVAKNGFVRHIAV